MSVNDDLYSQTRPGGRTLVVGAAPPNLDPLDAGHAETQRYRMRRVLIYADMVAKTGAVQWSALATWPYEPTEEEITAAIGESATAASNKYYAERQRAERRRVERRRSRLRQAEANVGADSSDDDGEEGSAA